MNQVVLNILSPLEIDSSCGTKATTLVTLKKLGIPVPDFYAISSSCFNSFCQEFGIKSPKQFYSCLKFDPNIAKKFAIQDILSTKDITQKIEDGKYMVRSSSIPTDDIDLKKFPSMISGAFESHFASTTTEIVNNVLTVWSSVFLEKAYNQCRIFSKSSIIESIGVVIQKYVEPMISGVAHIRENMVSVNWADGHLSKIVNGEALGNTICVYMSPERHYILRGIENDILLVKNNNYENVFKSLCDSAVSIRQQFKCDQEIEWLYDGEKVWIVQTQSLMTQK